MQFESDVDLQFEVHQPQADAVSTSVAVNSSKSIAHPRRVGGVWPGMQVVYNNCVFCFMDPHTP